MAKNCLNDSELKAISAYGSLDSCLLLYPSFGIDTQTDKRQLQLVKVIDERYVVETD